KNGVFSLGNRKHTLSLNEFNNHNHLHGGFYGFNTKRWEVDEYNAHSISLSYLSIDGEEGYPGNVQVYVTFTLDDTNSLLITYKAKSDQDTVLNLSNHSYFNLGNHQESIHNHKIQVFSDKYTPLDENYIPIGCIEKVKNTNYDLTNEKKVLEIEGNGS